MKKFTKIQESVEYLETEYCNALISKLLNALSEEIMAWYAYFITKPFLVGKERQNIEDAFDEFAEDELNDHGEWIINRINELGGSVYDISSPSKAELYANHKIIMPSICPETGNVDVIDALNTNIEMEIGAIQTYKDLVEFTDSKDPASNSKLKEILADEEEHLSKLKEFKQDIEYKNNNKE